MPNWCNNVLIIKGPEEEIEKFTKEAKGEKTEFSISKFLPIPEDLNIESGSLSSLALTFFGNEEHRKNNKSLFHKTSDDDWRKLSYIIDSLTEKRLPITFENAKQLVLETHPGLETFSKKVISNIEKYGYTDWYDWCIANWGTKWDVEAELSQREKSIVHYTFDSAWSPPLEAIKSISSKFPTLKFGIKYSEPGNCFAGEAVYKNGECVYERETEYDAFYDVLDRDEEKE